MEQTDLVRREDLEKAKNEIMRTVDEYQRFAFKGDFFRLASALIIAVSLESFVKTITASILMPLANFILFHAVGDWRDWNWTPLTGLTFEVGKTVNSGLDLFLITLLLFVVYKLLRRDLEQEEDKTRKHKKRQKSVDEI